MSSPQEEPLNKSNQGTFINESETDRLRRDVYRPDMEKFQLFTQMLRANILYKRAKITHKK